MRKTGLMLLLAAGISASALTGCGGENRKILEQAEKDLAQENYAGCLAEYETLISAEYKLADTLRGAGISQLRLGDYQSAIDYFTRAIDNVKLSKAEKKELLEYRATAELKNGQSDAAMSDCQTIAQNYEMDADSAFLTGCVALALNAYDEAASNFDSSYASDSTYDRAIQIYETYRKYDMEADGSRYLENALSVSAGSAEDYCSRGQIYYYMEDYENAKAELVKAVEKNSTEGMLLLGMVYMAQGDTSNARIMYQQYVDASGESPARGYNGLALCDIADGNYENALTDISNGLANASTEEMQDLMYNQVVVYEKQLDFASAYAKIQEYTGLFPNDEAAAKEQIFLQSRVEGGSSTDDSSEETAADTVSMDEAAGE